MRSSTPTGIPLAVGFNIENIATTILVSMLLDVKTLHVREFMLENLATFPKDLVNIGTPAVNPVRATMPEPGIYIKDSG